MKSRTLHIRHALFLCAFIFGIVGVSWGQTTVTYNLQDANFPTQFNSGGDFFNQGATELGMWANTDSKQTVAWRTFKTNGDNTGSDRTLQVGDVFKINIHCTRAFGQIGFSLNSGGTQGTSYANNISGSRLYFNTDNFGQWYVNRFGGTTNFGITPLQSTYKNYQFTVKITSLTTADAFVTVDGVDYRAYNLTMNGTNNIDAFSIYGSNMWDGDTNDNAFWKQTCSVTNSGSVELGYFLTSTNTFTPGLISDGLVAGSTTSESLNVVNIGGDAGSSVVLNQANTYTGTTTVNANATLRLDASSTVNSSGPLGTTAAGTSITSGGVLNMNGSSLTSSATEALTINGTGISSGGALINTNTSTASTWAGTVALGSASSVGGAGNLEISGVLSGAFSLTKVGAGALTLSNSSNSYSGGTVISGGTVSVSNAGHLGNTSGAITIGNGATSATLNITTDIARTALNVTDGSSAGVINVASGQTFTLTNLNTASGTNNATKIGKSGTGTLTLSGAGTYVGQTQIGEGTVIVSNATGLGTNTTTLNRSVDLGLDVGDVSQGNNVSLLLANVSINNSIYVAPNTSSATRTLGTSGATPNGTLQNEIYLDGNVTCAPLAGGTLTISGKITGPVSPSAGTSGLIASSGTTTLTNIANDYKGTTTISSGAELRLNPSGNATCSSQVVLNGGTLSTTSIAINRTITSTSTLSLTASSTIALGSNAHTLTFAASNGVSWTTGQIITITGWAGTPGSTGNAGKIFVGNSSSGLTAAQLVQIFFSGVGPATILSTGEIVPATASTVQYRSRITGNWATAATWEHSTNGTDWAIAGKAPASTDGAITILNTYTVTVSTAITADQLTVNAGGQITVNGNTFTIANGADTDITVNGILKVSTNSVSLNASATMTVGSGGVYEHNRTFTYGIPTATWNSGSTCKLTGASSTLDETIEQSFDNLTIAWSDNTARYFSSNVPTAVNGTFKVESGVIGCTGSASTNSTVTVNNFLMTGGGLNLNYGTTNSYAGRISANGNVTLQGGTLQFSDASTGVGWISCKGDLTIESGLTISGFLPASSGFLFNGTGASVVNLNQDLSSSVRTRFWTLTTSGPTSVSESYAGSTVQNTISGTTTPPTGYSAWPTSGSLLNNVTVNNSGGVTLSTSKVVNGALTLTSGKLAIGANTLTLNGTVASMSAANSLTGSATSNLSIGGTGSLGTLFFDQTTPSTTNVLGTFTVNRTNTGSVTLANDLQIATSLVLTDGTLSLGANTLTINGSVSRTNGLINASSGTVAFGNATDLSLPTGVFTGSIANLSKSSGAGTLTLNDALTTVGNLTTTASTGAVILAAGKQLTLTGALTNNGAMIIETGATFKQGTSVTGNGTYNVQQYLTGSQTGGVLDGRFWYMGVPLNVTRTSSFGDETSTNRAWTWSETGQQYGIVQNATTLTPTTGIVYRRGSNGTVNFNGSGASGTGLYAQDATLNGLTKTGAFFSGYHLLANPYTAYLDFEMMDAGSNNMSSTIWTRAAASGNSMVFDTYNATSNQGVNPSGGTSNQYIAPMQAFWVRVAGNTGTTGNISMTRAMTSHDGTGGLKSSAEYPAFARVNVVDGPKYDQTLVYLRDDQNNAVDAYDSDKMFATGLAQVYTMAAGKKLVMNGLKNNKKRISVPLYFDLPTSKVYELTLAEFNMENGIILLEDKQEGIIQDFTIHDHYAYYANSGTLNNRFVLHFYMPEVFNPYQAPSNSWAHPEPVEGGIFIGSDGRGKVLVELELPSETETDHVQIMNPAGQVVFEADLNGAQSEFELEATTGIYLVKVTNGSTTEIKKIIIQH